MGLVNAAIEAPRFGFPSLRGGPEYSPFLGQVPIAVRVEAAKEEWAAIGRQLAAEPE